MRKFPILFLSLIFIAGCSQPSETDSSVQGGQGQKVVVQDSQEAAEAGSDTFKSPMEAGQFENEVLSFALYYEYALAVKEVSFNGIEILEKDNPKSLASVEWYTNGEKDYFNYLFSLSQGGNWEAYEFSDADSNLKGILDVKVLNGNTYAITWKESIGTDFVIVRFDDTDTKSDRVATAILQTIELK